MKDLCNRKIRRRFPYIVKVDPMKILTKEDAHELLQGETLDAFIAQLSSQLRLVGGTYSIPLNSGVQIAFSKLFAYLVLRDSPVCLYVTGWSVCTEHLDLFYGYRRSVGDLRLLMEAPVHVFERNEEDALVSVLCMVFFFFWDAWVFDLAGRSLLRICHDGWMEVRAGDESAAKEIAAELGSTEFLFWTVRQQRLRAPNDERPKTNDASNTSASSDPPDPPKPESRPPDCAPS